MKQRDVTNAIKKIEAAETEEELEELRVAYLGRKGELTQELRSIGQLPESERSQRGKTLNQYKKRLEHALQQQREHIRAQRLETQSQQAVDLTRPGVGPRRGRLHPVETLQYEIIGLMQQIGFQVIEGPEVETDWYNFQALNIGPDHPARDTADTFYLEDGSIPRTHTSPVQIRYMEENKPPVRIISPGKVYRNEDEDATHLWSFHQMEGLVVDEGIRFSDLKGTLEFMLKGVFGEDTQLRLRPDNFPYTEPSAEVDASCMMCSEDGQYERSRCQVCGGTGWVELGGSGMVHPRVLGNVGIDPQAYSGFAFGFGLERLAAVKYQVPDLRHLWRPDLGFLEQF
jgi:phenylalanyl-tRNA synthetase alpha chain